MRRCVYTEMQVFTRARSHTHARI